MTEFAALVQGAKPVQPTNTPVKLFKPDSRFDRIERGVPVRGMVLVSTGIYDEDPGDMMCSEGDWRKRRDEICEHGFYGFTCKPCLQEDAGLPITGRQTRDPIGKFDRTTLEGAARWAEHLTQTRGKTFKATGETHTLLDGRTVYLVRAA